LQPLILDSWQRCRAAGTDPESATLPARRISPEECDARLAANAKLLEMARPHLEWLSAAHASIPHVISLVDRDGIVLHATGTPGMVERIAPVGADRSEAAAGTNGAGTALAAGQVVAVEGAEHFARALIEVASTGAPVHGTAGDIVGAVDMSTTVEHRAGERLVMMAHAAYAIESRIRDSAERRRTHALPRDGEARGGPAIRASEARFRSLSVASPVGIFQADGNGLVTYANPRALQILAMTEQEVLGEGWVARVHPDDVDAVLSAWRKAVRARDECEQECRLRLPDGAIRWVYCRAAPLFDTSGLMVGNVGTIEDITSRKELEAQLRQAQKMEAVGMLAGGVAHDFNNLLTVIKAHAELAIEAVDADAPLSADLVEIRNASSRAAALTQQLLAFSRKQVLQPRFLEMNALVASLVPMLERLVGEDIKIETSFHPDLGLVRADPYQLEQVLFNLAVNARDAMPSGGTLTLRTANLGATDADGNVTRDSVLLSVSDTGYGMTREVEERIFEPFFTTKALGAGTGLGLSTVYGIVEQSGGRIRVHSQPGKGTTFTLTLPSVTPEAAPPPAAAALLRSPRGGGETVLVVEDEDAVRRLTRRILERQGYTVLEARDGRHALDLAKDHTGQLDLLVTDLVMPELSGRAVAEHLTSARPELRVLYVSGYTDDEIVRRGLLDVTASSTRFLEKPFTAATLGSAVRRVLDEGRAQEEPA
jgi:PAS domain S-box-containing protein